MLAHIAIDFRGEMHWPGTVDIGTGIQSIGTSSFTVAQAVFKDGVCCATAKAIVVCIDQTTRRPRPLPEAARQAYQSLMVAAEPA